MKHMSLDDDARDEAQEESDYAPSVIVPTAVAHYRGPIGAQRIMWWRRPDRMRLRGYVAVGEVHERRLPATGKTISGIGVIHEMDHWREKLELERAVPLDERTIGARFFVPLKEAFVEVPVDGTVFGSRSPVDQSKLAGEDRGIAVLADAGEPSPIWPIRATRYPGVSGCRVQVIGDSGERRWRRAVGEPFIEQAPTSWILSFSAAGPDELNERPYVSFLPVLTDEDFFRHWLWLENVKVRHVRACDAYVL